MNINTDYSINSKSLYFKSRIPTKQFVRRIPDTVEILGQKYSTKEYKNLRGVFSSLIAILALPFSILGFCRPTDTQTENKILGKDTQIIPKKVNLLPEQEAELENLINEGKLDKNYAEIFKKLEGYEGIEFITKAYNLMAKSMGFEVYPELIINSDKKGSYSDTDRKIIISMMKHKTKEEQLGVIRHELEHYRQNTMMYRAFGREGYINALVQNYISKLKYCDEYCIKHFNKTYSELSENDIKNFMERVKREVYPPNSFERHEYTLKKMGQIKPDTEEYKEAEKYIKAQKEYVTINMFVMNPPITTEQIDYIADNEPEKFKALYDAMEENYDNDLEKGAIKEQNNIKEMYRLYCNIMQS